MKVKLISYSKGSSDNNLLEDIAYIARVSNPSNQNNSLTAEKLVRYLVKHKHWSPFEMASVCIEIETTRDISKQILRHRSFSFQEFSQRYAEPGDLADFVLREARMQDTENRQNSIECDNAHIAAFWENSQRNVISAARMAYEYALKSGIAKEQARAVLPEGCTPTRMYMNGTLRSWLHYIEIRSGVETQKEHREIALACAEEIKSIFPMVTEFIS
jgi:thymidylate synthase (FAD)